MPTFSIVIPTYNRAEQLTRALASVAQQTYRDFEVIVADDGSSDNTKDVVSAFAADMNLIYLYQENWGGPARPRNNALQVARGEWVCFLDSDDWWYPKKLERVANKTVEADVIYHDCDVCGISGKRLLKIRGRQLKCPVFVDLMTGWNALSNSTVCVRKVMLDKSGGFSEERNLIAIEDFDLWLRISKFTERFCYIPEPLGVYWVDNKNISVFTENSIERETSVHKIYAPYLSVEDRIESERMLCYRKGLILWHIGNKSESRKMFVMALKSKNKRTRYFALLRVILLWLMIFYSLKN